MKMTERGHDFQKMYCMTCHNHCFDGVWWLSHTCYCWYCALPASIPPRRRSRQWSLLPLLKPFDNVVVRATSRVANDIAAPTREMYYIWIGFPRWLVQPMAQWIAPVYAYWSRMPPPPFAAYTSTYRWSHAASQAMRGCWLWWQRY